MTGEQVERRNKPKARKAPPKVDEDKRNRIVEDMVERLWAHSQNVEGRQGFVVDDASIEMLTRSMPNDVANILRSLAGRVFVGKEGKKSLERMVGRIFDAYLGETGNPNDAQRRTFSLLMNALVRKGSPATKIKNERTEKGRIRSKMWPNPGLNVGLKIGKKESAEVKGPLAQTEVPLRSQKYGLAIGIGGNFDAYLEYGLGENLSILGGISPIEGGSPLFIGVGEDFGPFKAIIGYRIPFKGMKGGFSPSLELGPGLVFDLTTGKLLDPGYAFLMQTVGRYIQGTLGGAPVAQARFRGATYVESSPVGSGNRLRYGLQLAAEHLASLPLAAFKSVSDWVRDIKRLGKNVSERGSLLLERLENPSEEEMNHRWSHDEAIEMLHTLQENLEEGDLRVAKALANRFLKYRHLPPEIKGRIRSFRDQMDALIAVDASRRNERPDEINDASKRISQRLGEASERLDSLTEKWATGKLNEEEFNEIIEMVAYLQRALVLDENGPLSATFFQDSEGYRKLFKSYLKGLYVLREILVQNPEMLRKTFLEGEYSPAADAVKVLGIAADVEKSSTFTHLFEIDEVWREIRREGFGDGDIKAMLASFEGASMFVRAVYEVDSLNALLESSDYLHRIYSNPRSLGYIPLLLAEAKLLGDDASLQDYHQAIVSLVAEKVAAHSKEAYERAQRTWTSYIPILGPILYRGIEDRRYLYTVGFQSMDYPQMIGESRIALGNVAENYEDALEGFEALEEEARRYLKAVERWNERVASLMKKGFENLTRQEKRELFELLVKIIRRKGEFRESYEEHVGDVVALATRGQRALRILVPALLSGKAGGEEVMAIVSYYESMCRYVGKNPEEIRELLESGDNFKILDAIREIEQTVGEVLAKAVKTHEEQIDVEVGGESLTGGISAESILIKHFSEDVLSEIYDDPENAIDLLDEILDDIDEEEFEELSQMLPALGRVSGNLIDFKKRLEEIKKGLKKEE